MEAANQKKGKIFALEDDKGCKDLIVRNKSGTFILKSYIDSIENGTRIFGKASFLLQTRNM